MEQRKWGLIMAVLAYGVWGVFPLYVHQLRQIDPVSILAYRMLSTQLSLIPIVLFLGKGRYVVQAITNRETFRSLFLSASLISVNWGFFFYLICIGQTLQASLAYYVNPLVNVVMGGVFLGERFRRLQWVSIFIAALSVSILTYQVGEFPIWSLVLALTFAGYGFVRRSNPTDSLSALMVETSLMFPLALAFLLWKGTLVAFPTYPPHVQFWLLASGLITAIPLLLFGGAARRLKFSTLGLIHYITPTGQFLCAVYVLHEPMISAQWFCFSLIWIALVIFSVDSLRKGGRPEAGGE